MPFSEQRSVRFPDQNTALRIILEGTATETGERFFDALVVNLAKALNTHSAWVTEFVEETRHLRALSFWSDGRMIRDFEMKIDGTPCQVVIETAKLIHHPSNILEIFPETSMKNMGAVSYMGAPLMAADGKVLGNLAVLDTLPLPKEPRAEALMRIFAARASAELQRVRAERQIQRREERYRRIVETTSEGFLLMDKDFVITDVNDAYCRMIGYSRSEIIGKTPLDYVTEDFRQYLKFNRLELAAGDTREIEGTVLSKDGRRIPVLVHSNKLRDDHGVVIGNMNFVIDMTERKKSLELAAEVQRSLLPQLNPQIRGLDIAGRALSCDEIGGDYFDYLPDRDCPDGPLGVVVGDVTGHGVEAALLMTTARAFLRMRAAQCGAPSQIITEMNRHLARDVLDTGRFMTLFYLSIEPDKRQLCWVRAGHDPALIYDSVRQEFVELKGAGLALGVDATTVYQQNLKTGLTAGQVIIVGTDGIWESCDREGKMYGRQRFRDIIRGHAQLPATAIIEAVYDDVNQFTRGCKPRDDMTLVVIKVLEGLGPAGDWQI
ncbi:MAG: SpoIIE family protein phosphatase [Desulfobacterales bacterium]